MLTICDTHILLFWADDQKRLSQAASAALEIGMLYTRGRINNRAGLTCADYIEAIITSMRIRILPITPEIAELSQSTIFVHGDPADRLIAATALAHHSPLITADEKLRATLGLRCIW